MNAARARPAVGGFPYRHATVAAVDAARELARLAVDCRGCGQRRATPCGWRPCPLNVTPR